MNKKGQENNIGVYIVLAILAVFALYLVFKVLVTVGIVIGIGGIILLIFGVAMQQEDLTMLGIIAIVLGLIVFGLGEAGVNFFETNPTGSGLLGVGNTAINTTKTIVQGVR